MGDLDFRSFNSSSYKKEKPQESSISQEQLAEETANSLHQEELTEGQKLYLELKEQRKKGKVDLFFLQLTVLIILIGVFSIVSASWHESIRYTGSAWTFIVKHIVAVVLGLGVMFGAANFNYRIYRQFAWPIAIGCLILLLLTALPQFGVVTGGSRRWLSLGFFQLQISEFVKIAAVILMAKVYYERNLKNFFMALGLVSMMGFLVLKQPDLGTTVLIMSSIAFVAFAARFNLVMFIGAIGGLGWLVWNQILRTPYQMERIRYWLDPYADPLGHGYNLIQSFYAIGSGRIWGLGWGASEQKLGNLPVAHADFIFSIICEELGFLGSAAVLLVFLVWILRAARISFYSQDVFGKLLGVGLTGIFALQVVFNICVATGLLPTTGMTLPFVSFGGSSFLSCSLLAGIMLNISRYSEAEADKI